MVTVSEKKTPQQTPERTPRRKFSTGFDRFSGLYLGALFIIVFGIWVPSEFLTTSTLHSVAAQQAVTGMIGLAVLIPVTACWAATLCSVDVVRNSDGTQIPKTMMNRAPR